MAAPHTLSQTGIGAAWVGQFSQADQVHAAMMMDTMLLLNEDQVITSLRTALDRIAKGVRYRRGTVALYAEREFQENAIFPISEVRDAKGIVRRRSQGRKGPPAVKPIRGGARVGSEGLIAFVISQEKEAWPKIFKNQPGPDSLRARTSPAGEIVIVTDFIGSGDRVISMLEKFWAVPTIRAWMSRKLIRFRIVSAAATASGIAKVKRHRLRPEVIYDWIAPTVETQPNWMLKTEWKRLIANYGPIEGRGAGQYGFGKDAALIAFSYRIPNNAPAMVHHSQDGWKALYNGPAPAELHSLFGVKRVDEVIAAAAEENGICLGPTLSEGDRTTILVLSLLKGRWHKGSEIALSSKTGLTVPALMDVLRDALNTGLITSSGRLTDKGYAFLQAGRALERQRPLIATAPEPYYPESLRVPR